MKKRGRPLKKPGECMLESFRCLGTTQVRIYWRKQAKRLNITESQLLRLAIYNLIKSWTDAPLNDPMFKDIK